MSQDLIDLQRPGWGKLYQGTPVDAVDVAQAAKPLVLVFMDEHPEIHLDHVNGVHTEIHLGIADSPDAVLPDGIMLGLARGIAGLLKAGVNVRVQCGAGVSRSSYMTVATVMAALSLGFEPALAIVRTNHASANPNPGFADHLRRLEGPLIEGAGR